MHKNECKFSKNRSFPTKGAACGSYNTPTTTTAAPAATTAAAAAETTAAAAEAKAETTAAATEAAAPAADAITIVLGHFGAPGEPVTNAAETFKSELEKASNGAMTVEIHPNSELGNAKEMAERDSGMPHLSGFTR